jgi:hypothetical protein
MKRIFGLFVVVAFAMTSAAFAGMNQTGSKHSSADKVLVKKAKKGEHHDKKKKKKKKKHGGAPAAPAAGSMDNAGPAKDASMPMEEKKMDDKKPE